MIPLTRAHIETRRFSLMKIYVLAGLCLLFTACATTRPAPESWSIPEAARHAATPSGHFANQGESSHPTLKAPTLSALLFDNLLEGFDIDNIRFVPNPANDRLLIKPQVQSNPLREERILEAIPQKDGSIAWTAKTPIAYTDGYTATTSILWTGGTIMPIVMWTRYRFYLDPQGNLLVHLTDKEIVNFFYLFPVPFKQELWLRYPAFIPPVDQDAKPVLDQPKNESP